MNDKEYVENYLKETKTITDTIDQDSIIKAIEVIRQVRKDKGRMFILGVGGSAGNASHAVNDFRKIAGMECYAPTDNVSELTAWTNDNGWEYTFEKWLEGSQMGEGDAILVLSVGGGSETTSQNIVRAMRLAEISKTKIVSIVSRDGGIAKKLSDACILVPVVDDSRITPHAEGWQGIIWHLIVNAL